MEDSIVPLFRYFDVLTPSMQVRPVVRFDFVRNLTDMHVNEIGFCLELVKYIKVTENISFFATIKLAEIPSLKSRKILARIDIYLPNRGGSIKTLLHRQEILKI